MRKAIRLVVVLLATTSASSCASPLGQASATHGGASAVMPAQASAGSATPGFFGSVTGAVHNGTTAMVAWATPAPQTATAVDPTSLSSKSGKATPDLHIAMAEMQEKLGHVDEARRQYELALKDSPHHLGALLGLAHLLDRQGKLPEATPKYELACKYHPKEARPLNDLGLCYFRQHKFGNAAKALTKAVDLEPLKPLYRNNLATVLTEMGRADDALVQLTAVHGPAVAHYNVGYLLYQKGNRAGAAYHFAEASKADPSLVAAREWSEQLAVMPPASEPAGPSRPASRPTVASRPAPTSVPESYAAPIVTIGAPLRTEAPVRSVPVVSAAPFVPEARESSPPVEPAPYTTEVSAFAPLPAVAAAQPVEQPAEPFYRNALRGGSDGRSDLRGETASADKSRPAPDFITPRIASAPRPLPPVDQSESRDR